MTEIIRVRKTVAPRALPDGMIEVEGTAYIVPEGKRSDIAEEQIRRQYFWRRERLGCGVPARR